MNKRNLMEAEILRLVACLDDETLEEFVALAMQKAGCRAEANCDPCSLKAASASCHRLSTIEQVERKGYLRWMKAKHPELRIE
jgi:hypothetical protein